MNAKYVYNRGTFYVKVFHRHSIHNIQRVRLKIL